ncbi:hypothetical protein H2200_001010 [Cladophialophora chaetospira]|uniref:XRCC4 coiled-coil domain-containing protein n=1 Tax=Cladophialophora chaetospira TaxID=386627 RepID=A0AA39CPQ0_9EURO|nr:hypothetical protein H2200_001010 [Cladophialophora chaetospira]
MAATWVIRLQQDDKERTPILINVSHKEAGHDLDLDLLATDGEGAFTAKVRQRSLKKLRAKNYDGSDDDWSNILSSILNPTIQPTAVSQQKNNLDVTCSTTGKEPKRVLSIAFSNKVEEITQRLGTIELSETADTDEVDLFGWASQALTQRDELRDEINGLGSQVKRKDDIVSSLQKQIDELVEAKAEHEKQMLSKFTLLLNEKKLKIRNMQRILATAKTDKKKLKEMEAVIGEELVSVARRKKRPADEEAEDEEAEDSEAFEAMDTDPVTNAPKSPNSPASGNTTPTASEAEDSDVEATHTSVAYPDRPRRAIDAPSGREQAPQKSQPARTMTDDDDEETASEDDEL